MPSSTRTMDGWIYYPGVDPDQIQRTLTERSRRRRRDHDERQRLREAERAAAQTAAQPRVERFRELLETVLGVVPHQEDPLAAVDYDARVTISYRLLVIGEAQQETYGGGRETQPARTLTAVLADDDQVHIHVTGRPERSGPYVQHTTWDAGPITSRSDLARIIEARGEIHWSPPTPEPEPAPAPEPTVAEIARGLLDELAQSPINRQGTRGIALAQAYATLAASERHAQAIDES